MLIKKFNVFEGRPDQMDYLFKFRLIGKGKLVYCLNL